MKKILLAVAVLTTTFLFSCKSGGDDPKAVLADFFTALSKKDIAKAKTLATEDSKQMLDMMEMGMNMADKDSKGAKEDEKYKAENLTYGDAKIDGDKAIVPVTEKVSGETMSYTLKKVKGTWKVAFDKQTIMTMGMEKMGDKLGETPSEELDSAMSELDKLNTDSIKNIINEGLKGVDSLKKLTE
ncbi:MAG: DUF4878 domain-containing protein [Ferruginibacter sp.]|nr:DUF4878 domain-containing protein [Ferruginibacter sp.]